MAPSSPVAASEEEPVDLSELTLEELMQVEITTASKVAESRFEAPGVISIVTAEEIRRSGARTVEALLNRVTGMYLYSSYMFPKNRMSLRGDLAGHYDNHVLLLINGRPFRDSMLGGMNSNFYQAFPISAIHHIEVVRGPGSVLYGSNAFVGVINVITRKGEDQVGAMTVGGGSWKTVYTDASLGLESDDSKLKASFAGTYHTDRGWKYTATDETIGPLLANLDSAYAGSESGGGYVNLSYGEFALDAFLSAGDNDMLGVLPIWPMQALYQPHRHFVDASWSHPFSENLSLTANATYNYSEWIFVVDDPGPLTPEVVSPSHSMLLELSSTYSPLESAHITGGVVSDYRRGLQEALGAPTPDIPLYSEWWWSGYLQADYKPIDRVKLIAGVQWNKPTGLDLDWLPRAGVIVSITDEIGLKGLYGEAYRAPLPGETDLDAGAILQGNPDLDSEKLRTWDVELNYHHERIQASLSYYHTSQKELIIRSDPGTGMQFFNQGGLTLQGVELDWKYAVTDNWYLNGSYRYQWNEDEAGNSNATLAPNHMFKIGASYSSPRGFLVGAFYSLLSEAEHLNVAKVNPDPENWHLLDVNLELDLNLLLKKEIPFKPLIRVRGTNLANTDMDFPEFVRRNINSLPQGGGAAGFADLTLRF